MQLLGELSLVVASLSIVVGMVFFYLEYRRSRRDKGYESYVGAMMALIDLKKQMVGDPGLQSMYEFYTGYEALSPNQRKTFHWSGILLDIGEIVFIASPLGRGWMGEDEWDGWKQFLSRFMANNEIFRLVWTNTREDYGKRYRQFVDEIHEETRVPDE
ncbi:MAG: hypothetical protein ACFFD9_10840 [Candidatus Thorarchaeota archaeon]